MPRRIIERTAYFYENEDWFLWARIAAPNKVQWVKADVGSWTLRVYDISEVSDTDRLNPIYTDTGTNASVNDTPLTDDDVITNTLRTEVENDGNGYNWLYVVDMTALAAATPPVDIRGGRTYMAEFEIPGLAGRWGDTTVRIRVEVRAVRHD